jgi:hypothetical protein
VKGSKRDNRRKSCIDEDENDGDDSDNNGDDDGYRILSRTNSQGKRQRCQLEKQRQLRNFKQRLHQQQEARSKHVQKRPRAEDNESLLQSKEPLVQQPQQQERIWDKGGKLSSKIQATVRCGDIWNEGIVWPRAAEISLLGALGCGKVRLVAYMLYSYLFVLSDIFSLFLTGCFH